MPGSKKRSKKLLTNEQYDKLIANPLYTQAIADAKVTPEHAREVLSKSLIPEDVEILLTLNKLEQAFETYPGGIFRTHAFAHIVWDGFLDFVFEELFQASSGRIEEKTTTV
jgi:hypothetical protein